MHFFSNKRSHILINLNLKNWAILVHQINMTNENEVELYLAIGNHKVIFGDAIDIDEKFKNSFKFQFQVNA